MLLVWVLIIWQTHAMPYNMYNTNNHQDGYCLLHYVYEPELNLGYQTIPYCLRSFDKELLDIDNLFDSKFTFTELQEKNVSSEMLLSWSSSIDLAEEYEIFLDNLSYSSLPTGNETVFFNCTLPWFGPHCLFAFDPEMNASFYQIVQFNFKLDQTIWRYPTSTCYVHIDCGRSQLCLDWREICDRKIDCLDGSDELNCWQLEMNECSENEYRCHNGQCIPAKFFHDHPNDTDCMDRTDEPMPSFPYECTGSPAFHCEESICRLGQAFFPCGDGDCSLGTSTCRSYRDNIFLNDSCSKAMGCVMNDDDGYYDIDVQWCENFCPNNNCVQDYCASIYVFPSHPIAFGHVRFAYLNKPLEINTIFIPLPDYICYDENLCENYYPPTVRSNGLTCRLLQEFGFTNESIFDDLNLLTEGTVKLFHKCLMVLNKTHDCNDSIMYQCFNSTKCISKHRLLDGIYDCPFNDDETFNETCSLSNDIYRFNCTVDNSTKCFSPLVIQDNTENCENGEDEVERMTYSDKHIYFQTICDGTVDLPPQFIDGRNETDETTCENWPCNNTYTRCNGEWSCKDGADEINCPYSTCSRFEHSCIFFNDTSKISCLPIARAGDGIVDCLGATDERIHCQYKTFGVVEEYFQCWNDTTCVHPMMQLCNAQSDCPSGDDEIFCSRSRFFFCSQFDEDPRTEVEQFFCSFTNARRSYHLRLTNVPTYPTQLIINNKLRQFSSVRKTQWTDDNFLLASSYPKQRRCNRGIPILIRGNGETTKSSCLCSPSYYGNECQYQNERVSLTLRVRVRLDWRIMFTLIITLIDQERNIQSHEQIEYSSIRDCDTKFHIYLLYSTRPKNSSTNYFLQIDLFNKITFEYRASWIFSLPFFFLPVYRQSVLLEVPVSETDIVEVCPLPCIHGKCLSYVNNRNSTFCQCLSGWSGVQCNIEYRCDCAPSSVCVGKSICLCPIGRYGPRCHLRQSLCHSKSCANGGQCIIKYEHYLSLDPESTMCVCPEQFTGDRCEHQQTRIVMSFDKTIHIPDWLFIHFIRIENDPEPIRMSVMKKIAYDQNSLIIYTSMSFNFAFIQIVNAYYLIILREEYINSANISTIIRPSYQCKSIGELFNMTFANQTLLKRIKSYHIPCEQRPELVCFYDNIYFCLCNLDRQANCFEFTYNMTYDCTGNNFCENGGTCFEDDSKCPTSSICGCPDCYYGSKCQFSTQGSTLSLDAILGYQIRPNVGINQQSTAIKVGISLSIITSVLGLVSSLLSLLTFRMEKTQDVGCGLYLLVSSIISIITTIVLTIKFWFLLGSQMGWINSHSFVHIQCLVVDYFLRFLLSTGDWLSACASTERAMTVLKGAQFNKNKSKQVAKWIILVVFLLTTSTYIHDPVHRSLIDDKEEQRAWCITTYSSSVQQFDWAINILHFALPFLINLASALIIIILATRIRSKTQKKQTYKEILHEQLKRHKHLLISPFILFLLALPRLIISFLSGCMKSARKPWLYLIGYFISFTPPMLTFFVFVLTSKLYKQEFTASVKRLLKT